MTVEEQGGLRRIKKVVKHTEMTRSRVTVEHCAEVVSLDTCLEKPRAAMALAPLNLHDLGQALGIGSVLSNYKGRNRRLLGGLRLTCLWAQEVEAQLAAFRRTDVGL